MNERPKQRLGQWLEESHGGLGTTGGIEIYLTPNGSGMKEALALCELLTMR